MSLLSSSEVLNRNRMISCNYSFLVKYIIPFLLNSIMKNKEQFKTFFKRELKNKTKQKLTVILYFVVQNYKYIMPDIYFILQEQCVLLLFRCLTWPHHVSFVACIHSTQTDPWGKIFCCYQCYVLWSCL